MSRAKILLTPAGFARSTSGGRWTNTPDPSVRSINFNRHHLSHLSEVLMGVAAGHRRRQIVTFPPRHGKSELCSVYFPAWYLGMFPDKNIMLLSYSASLAESFSERSRDLLAVHGPRMFGVAVDDKHASRGSWRTTAGGGMHAAGVGGPITGLNADLILIDDYVKNDEEACSPTMREKLWTWFTGTLAQRIMPKTSVMIIATRWHRDDLIGRIVKQQQSTLVDSDYVPYDILRYPARASLNDPLGREVDEPLWPEMRSDAFLRETKAQVSPTTWTASYMCQPPSGDGMSEWSDEYFHDNHIVNTIPQAKLKILSIDPSKGKSDKADYSAFVKLTLGHDNLLYVDADLRRIPLDSIVDTAMSHIQGYGPNYVSCEVTAFQEMIASQIEARSRQVGRPLEVFRYQPVINKIVRIRTLLGPFMSKSPEMSMIRWADNDGTRLLLDQLRDFPNAMHDDGPDGLAQAIDVYTQLCYNNEPDPIRILL